MWLIFAAIIICQTGIKRMLLDNNESGRQYSIVCADGSGQCSCNCVDGYYGNIETNCTNCPHNCDINGKCYTCPENCENCTYNDNSILICDTCKAGYYGHQCNLNCSQNCKDRECDKDNGACSAGCVVGFRGHECDRNCSMGCQNNECKQNNGVCSHGCVDGYYGSGCDRNCSLRCQDMECSRYNGMCIKGCIGGFYGPECERKCSPGCQDTKCNQTDAACSIGCIVGFYGPLCNKSCSKACRLAACHRVNGTCMHGCVEGYYGETCHQCHNCTKEMVTPLDKSNLCQAIVGSILGPAIVGSIFGTALLMVAAATTIFLVRRRFMRRAPSPTSANTDRRYDYIPDISPGDLTHNAAVDEGQRVNTISGSVHTVGLYANTLDKATDNPDQNASLDVERGMYETLGNTDYDDNVHVYNTAV